jgi:multiple sugar transport system substrate-binding protein
MLQWIDEKFADNTFVLPVEWDEDYGSTNFKYGDVAMTVGSTAGVAYNIPSEADEQDSLQLGIFNVGFAPTPQPAANEGDQFTVTIDGTDETYTGSLSAVQQGPNIGIFKDATPEERIYAWLLIKHLISAENTAAWAMETGYLPARLSGYNSQEYSDFLEVGEAFLDADGEPGWETTDPRWNDLHASMASLVARAQNDFYQYDPAFAASSTSAGSAKVRVEAGYCLENIYIGRYDTPEESLTRFINAVIWE